MPYHPGEDAVNRIDPVVFLGGFALALLAGFVNGSMLDVLDVPVSHMSGAVSRLGIELAHQRFVDVTAIALVIGFFLIGAAISGSIIGTNRLRPGKPYGVVMMIEACALLIAWLFLRSGSHWSLAFAALGCGLQNAMASSYYGLIIRTTHVTGVVTDIGFMLGAWLRHRTIKPWKLLLLGQIVLGFALGGYSAVMFRRAWQDWGMLIASLGCLAVGAYYWLWHHYRPGTAAHRRS